MSYAWIFVKWKRIHKLEPKMEKTKLLWTVICHLHVSVAGDRRDICNTPKHVHLRDNEGYISNKIAAESSLGTLTCPWSIKARSLQRIKLSVYDFGSVKKSEDRWQMDQNQLFSAGLSNVLVSGWGWERRGEKTSAVWRRRKVQTSVHITYSSSETSLYDAYSFHRIALFLG